MAAEAAISNNASVMQTSIISDQRAIQFIYKAIQDAGINAHDIEKEKRLPYYLTEIGSSTRLLQPRHVLNVYDKPPLAYISKDITIIGGSALNIYDSKLVGFKQRRPDEFKSLRNELDRETTDIDMVWWPRETNKKSGYIYTADSTAIFSFVQTFIQSLYYTLNKLPKGLIQGFTNVEIQPRFIPTIGVHFITITFLINNIKYKIADLAIHDNGGSQQYDSSGNEIKEIVSMYDDPIYCSSISREEYSTTSFYNTRPYVPNITWYVKQQLFAFGNFRMRGDLNKMNIIQKRIEYLIKILKSYLRSHTNNNKRNLTEVFGVDDNYGRLVEHIILLAKEKGIDFKEKEDISENNIKKMAEYSKKVLESTNANQVKKYTEFMGELNKMQKNNSDILIYKYADLMKYFLELLKEMEYMVEVAKTNTSINTNKPYKLKIYLIVRLYHTYSSKFNYYNEKGDHFITELLEDHDNKEYKLKFNELIHELEENVISLRNHITTLTHKNLYTHITGMSTSASNRSGGTRKHHGYKRKTKKHRSNANKNE